MHLLYTGYQYHRLQRSSLTNWIKRLPGIEVTTAKASSVPWSRCCINAKSSTTLSSLRVLKLDSLYLFYEQKNISNVYTITFMIQSTTPCWVTHCQGLQHEGLQNPKASNAIHGIVSGYSIIFGRVVCARTQSTSPLSIHGSLRTW